MTQMMMPMVAMLIAIAMTMVALLSLSAATSWSPLGEYRYDGESRDSGWWF